MIVCPAGDGTAAAAMAAPAAQTVPAAVPAAAPSAVKVAENAAQSCAAIVDYFPRLFSRFIYVRYLMYLPCALGAMACRQ